MKYEDFLTAISKSIEARFKREDSDTDSKSLENLAPEGLRNKILIRIQRSISYANENKNWKTLLIVGITEREQMRHALEWVSLVKDSLLDPETSDLYLFLSWDDKYQPSLEECLRIESTEELCRKYVLRPSETGESFIGRTFLVHLNDSAKRQLGTDPLVNVFSSVANDYTWFTKVEQEKWKEAFMSGLTGAELIEAMFSSTNE